MKQLSLFTFILALCFACQMEKDSTESPYLRWVGDIAFDESLDNPEFTLCNGDNNIFQYHNVANGIQYEGEKTKIIKAFSEGYNLDPQTGQSGMIRIRFIVNCSGETDRFRIMGADENYKAFDFDPQITNQLMAIAKSLNGWKPLDLEGEPVDYYQYLIFKMKDGEIQKILP